MQKRTTAPRSPRAAAIRTAAQYEAISSPVRDQILQVVVNQSPGSAPGAGVSVREIGDQLGRKPGSLYRHIEELVRVGLIVRAGPESSGGRDAQTYAAAGDVFRLETPADDPDEQGLDALCGYIQRAAAYAGKEHAAATREHARRPTSPREHAMLSMFGWLDAKQRAQMKQHMLAMAEIFQNARRRPGSRLIAASVFIRPVRLPVSGNAEDPPKR